MTHARTGTSGEGCGCIAVVLAVFLAVVLWHITPELIAWLESTLRSNT